MSGNVDWLNVKHTIEFSHIYDGYSAVVMNDGRIINRWDPNEDPLRHMATERAICAMFPEYKGRQPDPEGK